MECNTLFLGLLNICMLVIYLDTSVLNKLQYMPSNRGNQHSRELAEQSATTSSNNIKATYNVRCPGITYIALPFGMLLAAIATKVG